MIVHCKNTLGDGTVVYVDYEVPDPIEQDEEVTDEEALDIILGGGTT